MSVVKTPAVEIFSRNALQQIPQLLTLQDRNPHSPTYGCFDRNFWQYRLVDFPTGMAQEFVYPLALAYSTKLPDNPYFGDQAICEWVKAGINFADKSSHSDGSCDDFYPYERAAGAAAFSLFGCLEAYHLLQIKDAQLEKFFTRRGRWLAKHPESGKLSNHEALIVYCLYLLSQRFEGSVFAPDYRERLDRLLSWQHKEGWFVEYNGCDLGYQTLTISMLAQLYDESREEGLREPLERAIAMTAQFMHPDGSFGGEYGSRNTYNYFPHGFEIAGKWLPEALELNDRFAIALQSGRAPCYLDDHMIAHHMWSYLLAARYYTSTRNENGFVRKKRAFYEGAGLLVDRRDEMDLYVALNKGGSFKLFRRGEFVASDTQISLKMRDGSTAVCHHIDDYAIDVGADYIEIAGNAGWAKQKLMLPLDNILLRTFMLTIGRFFPGFVRRLLQQLLITYKRIAPFQFSRRFEWEGGELIVSDCIGAEKWDDVISAGVGGHQTSISVVQSRPYHPSQHQPWLDITKKTQNLKSGQALRIKRKY